MTNNVFNRKKQFFYAQGKGCRRDDCKANSDGECICLICSDFNGKPCPFYKSATLAKSMNKRAF